MPVLDRSELEASPLADLHAIADQLGLEGFRRLRKAELIDAILGTPGTGGGESGEEDADGDDEDHATSSRVRGRLRRRRGRRRSEDEDDDEGAEAQAPDGEAAVEVEDAASGDEPEREEPERRRSRGRARAGQDRSVEARTAEGVVEVLGNGSAFLRVDPPEPSDEDVYISAAQVRRCELVTGDRVSGPVRTPRRSERYPSLVRVEEINGAAADEVSDGSRYEDQPVAWPSERLQLDSRDRTLEAIEWLTPFGLGSRVVIAGGRMAGKTRTLQRLRDVLAAREDLTLTVVLAGVRPEEIADWSAGEDSPAAGVSFAASPDAQAQLLERALDAARRVAARGGNAVVLIDSLDGISANAARKSLAAARNLRDGGSLTIIATASEPLGGETTVIALDPNLTTTGREPILDLLASGTLRSELLVGEDGAQAIARARSGLVQG